MQKIVFVFLFLGFCCSSFAENDSLPITYDTVLVKFFVTDAKNNQPLKDVYALVELDRQIIFTSDTTTIKGKTNFHLHITNAVYTITICKKGYYSKIIWVHTKKIPAQRMKRPFTPIDIEISLFEKMPNINFPSLIAPVLKYYYSKYDEEFIQDFDYSVSIMKQQEMINTKIKEYQVWKKDSFESAQINRADSFCIAGNIKAFKVKDPDTAVYLSAITDYYNAIKLKPNFWQAYHNKAVVHIYLKQYNQAIIDLTVAMKYANGDFNADEDLYYLRGEALYYSGQYEYAIQDFDKAVDFKGTSAMPLLLRAKAKWKLGKYDEACMDYKKAVELNNSLEEQKEFLDCK